ncbi:SurA N-terminal domain-containing protein [Candidatus Saccharibacteria bacterium]|nr:SurA N-terminal domain-containing protein [Candidatus Saccharibacteria bacterium]
MKSLEEQREEVLSGGKKFKRTVQYEKHRVLINSAILVAILVAVLGVGLWASLYRWNVSSDVVYNVTRVLPLRVASVDGEPVRFSDFLMQYRSSIRVIERQEGPIGNDEEGREIRNHFRRASLDNAQMNAFARGLARNLEIEVTREQEDALLLEHRLGGSVSEESFMRMVRDNYGLSMSEYRRLFVYFPLLRRAVAVEIDTSAREVVAMLNERIHRDGSNFETVAEEHPELLTESSGGLIDVWTADGGRAAVANSLEVGHASEAFLANDGSGWFIVKLLDRQGSQVSYLSIFVPLLELDRRFNEIRENGGIREYIDF